MHSHTHKVFLNRRPHFSLHIITYDFGVSEFSSLGRMCCSWWQCHWNSSYLFSYSILMQQALLFVSPPTLERLFRNVCVFSDTCHEEFNFENGFLENKFRDDIINSYICLLFSLFSSPLSSSVPLPLSSPRVYVPLQCYGLQSCTFRVFHFTQIPLCSFKEIRKLELYRS
jgi:hypothetical protein